MMNQFLKKYGQIAFYSLWTVSLILQVYCTELGSDEAYYWMYSRELDWGYFDHPPVIACLIKVGYGLFHNELGVRLLPILLSGLTIYLCERLITPRKRSLFYLIVLSIAVIHFMGFFALPDSPLLLSCALYLLLYRKFLERPGVMISLVLGGTIALMILSKYHGVLIVFMTVLSNWKLIKNRYFWLVATVVIVALTPHILWQYNMNFPSIRYHLFGRSAEPYMFRFTWEYLLTELYVLGPFTGIVMFIVALRVKAKDDFERSLKFLFWGCYIFFFFMTFKGRVEAHWTFFVMIPGIYLGYRWLEQRNARWFRTLAFVSFGLIFVGRMLIAMPFDKKKYPVLGQLTAGFNSESLMKGIHKTAGNYPVAFIDSYQMASLYGFYSGQQSFSFNSFMGRQNQFNLWDSEGRFRGKSVMVIMNYKTGYPKMETAPEVRYTVIDNFQGFSSVFVQPVNFPKQMKPASSQTIKLQIVDKNSLDLGANLDYPVKLFAHFFEESIFIETHDIKWLSNDDLNKEIEVNFSAPEKPGNYAVQFSLKAGWLPGTRNSENWKLNVK